MKPVLTFKELPDEYVGNGMVVLNEKRGDEVIAYIYENNILTHICVVRGDKWDTYDTATEKWGKATVEHIIGWRRSTENKVDFETVRDIQERVKADRANRRERKKRQDTARLMDQAKPLTEAFRKWARNRMVRRMIFETSNRRTGYCTCCDTRVFMPEDLKHRGKFKCPACGRTVEGWATGKLPKGENRTFALFQKIDTGIMCRYVTLHRSFSNFVYDHPDEWGKNEYFAEYIRVVVENGKRQWWYEKRSYWLENAKWERNNVKQWVKSINCPGFYGWQERKSTNTVDIYGLTLSRVLESTPVHYVGKQIVDEYFEHERSKEKSYAILDVIEMLGKNPEYESLYKIGLNNLCLSMMRAEYTMKKAKGLHNFLGISKEVFRCIRKGSIKCESVAELRRIQSYNNITNDTGMIAQMDNVDLDQTDMEVLMREAQLPLRKTLRYLEDETRRGWLYRDYIRMALNLGYDLTDDFVRYPRDLEQAHNAAMEVRDERRNLESLENAKKDDKSVIKVMKKQKSRLTMQIDDYVIRPAMSNTELVKEGQQLHHCVGGGTYKFRILQGISYILFLRKKETPETPYYTIEITPQGRVTQAYGIRDSKPDWEQIEPVIKKIEREVNRRWTVSCKKKESATFADQAV